MAQPQRRRVPRAQAEAAVTAAIATVRARRKRPPERLYWDDPVAWLHDRIDFKPGEGPTPYQEELLAAVAQHHRATGRGPHGLGKTTLGAWILLWFVDTRSRAREDWKAVTTAGSWAQLRNFFWPEVHKWVRRGAFGWREGQELLQLTIKLGTGQAFGVASNRPELIEGAHADQLLYIYDEAKSIEGATFDASEGAFSGAGPGTGRDAFAWAGSTPGAPIGRFSDIHHRKPGLDDWYSRHVTLQEAMDAGRISEQWVTQRGKQWGVESAVYRNRVLGEFATEDANTVIPLAWLEASNRRWDDLMAAIADGEATMPPFSGVAADVARFGEDRTVLALRHEHVIRELRDYSKDSTTTTTGHVAGVLNESWGWASVDVVGLGAGVVDQLRDAGYDVRAFNASARSNLLDRSGELGFVNRRAAAWWGLRELLDPSFDPTICIPPSDMLTGDLTAGTWRVTAGAKIAVEGKDDIRKRLGRSTDFGDAVVQAFAPEDDEPVQGTIVYEDPVEISPY